MEGNKFKYLSIAHSASRCGYVGIVLEREDGGRFTIVLTTDDAVRLLDDLPMQVRIAAKKAD